MKSLSQLILEATNKVPSYGENDLFPFYPYVRGMLRITQLAVIGNKLRKEIVKFTGGDYFINTSNKYYHKPMNSIKDGKFIDSSIFNPSKQTEKVKSSQNTTIQARVDLQKRIIAIDTYNTKTGEYRKTFYYEYLDEKLKKYDPNFIRLGISVKTNNGKVFKVTYIDADDDVITLKNSDGMFSFRLSDGKSIEEDDKKTKIAEILGVLG